MNNEKIKPTQNNEDDALKIENKKKRNILPEEVKLNSEYEKSDEFNTAFDDAWKTVIAEKLGVEKKNKEIKAEIKNMFAREYKEMLNYFKPKQQSQQIKQETSINISLLPADNKILDVLGEGEVKILDNE